MKQKKFKNANEMAKAFVGDGKSPNKYFVSIGYGWWKPINPELDAVQVPNSMEGITIGPFDSLPDAERVYDAIPLYGNHITTLKGDQISQVFIEDRKTGVVKEKYLAESREGWLVWARD